jgi:hypothetical protein
MSEQPSTPEKPESDPIKYRFPGAIDRDHLHTEQPIDPMINSHLKRPNPLDPMGNIEMEGRALRTLASGRVPLWIVMVGWGTIGLGSFLLLGVAMHEIVTAFREGDRGGELLATAMAFAPMALATLLMITILFRATWRQR